MQNTAISRTKGKCPACGKEVILRDLRDTKPQYCSRICSEKSKYLKRYRGSGSGPMDRPKRDLGKF